jgi:hypothetical protein
VAYEHRCAIRAGTEKAHGLHVDICGTMSTASDLHTLLQGRPRTGYGVEARKLGKDEALFDHTGQSDLLFDLSGSRPVGAKFATAVSAMSETYLEPDYSASHALRAVEGALRSIL